MTKKIFLGVFLLLLFCGGFALGHYIKKNYFRELTASQPRTNFLLLGINGDESAGADLTDTIIFASINRKTGQVALVSLPRDIWVPALKAKLNTAYHYGGVALARETITQITGQDIHYYVVVDFKGFEEMIDLLGGVWVEVEKSFDDYRYPIAGKENEPCPGDPQFQCRYEHLHFEAGEQLMDGQRALKYVRSRHAEGDEGTDFARTQRQQQLLKGLKKTAFTTKLYFRPGQVKALFKAFRENVKTDITPEVYGSLLLLAKKADWEELATLNLEEYLVSPKRHPSGQWVLEPKSGSFQEIRDFLDQGLE